MAKKVAEVQRTFHVSVVGLSGTEKEKGSAGVGKSCLCNRFLRPLADEYSTDHISVLSQSDFGGRVVNNDHFLYWGEVTKTSDEGIDIHFNIVEQTEFIDDASFQPFKGGKTDPYMKRCSATKLSSAEKLMYICKNQLGIEKEYEQKVLPDGKINLDGFICTFDVSSVPNRTIEKQVDMVAAILNNLLRTKKPIVLATTKNDEADDHYLKEVERLLSRKEFKGSIPMVETSAHENVNVELAFIVLAQMIDRTKGRSKLVPFAEAARARREVLDVATDAYLSVIRSQVKDYTTLWGNTIKKLAHNQDFIHFCDLFGQDKAQREFRRHVKRLKDEFIQEKKQGYLVSLPDIFHKLLPDLNCIGTNDWNDVQCKLKEHSDFSVHFVECSDEMPWEDSDLMESSDPRVPYDLLETSEAETAFRNHLNALRAKEKTQEMKKLFKKLLEETGYVTPGKSLPDVKVLFMGRECFEALSDEDSMEIYDIHQKEIIEKAKLNFQELLLEHADLFYQLTSTVPSGAITQEDIREIENVLQEDSRYKALDRIDQDRMLILYQHLGFVHCPIREHCPSYPNCMDTLIEKVVSSKMQRNSSCGTSSQLFLNSENNQLNLVLLGSGGIAESLANEIRAHCEDDEYELENILYTLDYRVISGDVTLPQNSILTADFLPHGFQLKEPLRGCFCIYSDMESFEYIRKSLEATLMCNLEQEGHTFQELPINILFAANSTLGEKDLMYLKDEGQTLADTFQWSFVDLTADSGIVGQRFHEEKLQQALRSLVELIQHRAESLTIYQSHNELAEPDIRVIMCLLCGDPYSVEHVLSPLLGHSNCIISGDKSILLETYLGECKRRVEVIVSSYHGANTFRDELVHGFILVYSIKRKASLAMLKAFSMNIPNLPIQILAVTESGGANAFFSSNLSHSLITEGNAIADQLQAHFMTTTSTSQQKTAFYTPFFKEVWDKKPEIEQAFNMEEPAPVEKGSGQDQETPEKRAHPPSPPHRQESYHTHTGSADGSAESESHYERMPTDGSQGDDMDEPASPTFVDDRDVPLSPSDDSDLYYNVYGRENGESLVKPSQLRKRGNLHDGYFDDNFFQPRNHRDHWAVNDAFRSYTTGRKRFAPPTKPKPGKLQPGKLDLKNFGNVTNAIAKLSLGSKEQGSSSTTTRLGKSHVHAPLATPESVELGSEYALVKDAVPAFAMNDNSDYAYATVQDALQTNRIQRIRHSRREAGKAKFSTMPVADDTNYEMSSPKDSNSPTQLARQKDGDKTGRRKEKQKLKEDEKLEKRRQKEEEKQKRLAEKEKEKLEKKKQKKGAGSGGTLKSGTLPQHMTHPLEEFAQSDDNPIPLFLEKCIKFIEEEGLDSEGIYRVPGNRAHVDLLFQRFEDDVNISIRDLDIPVNAVATALKDFFSKRLPPLMSVDAMNALITDISSFHDRSRRLLSLRDLLKKLPNSNFRILKFVFAHFVRVSENCKLNSMDSKNLAICWWPTLLPIEFTDMGVFERMRPNLEDAVQNMIDQYNFLFCGKDEVVKV